MSGGTGPSTASIELDPGPGLWEGLAQRSVTPEAKRFREQLGLPADRPIIMTGHQAELWHPGILAKLFAAQALADRVGGEAVWLVVDQDANDPFALRLPVREPGEAMREALLSLAPHRAALANQPTGLIPVAGSIDAKLDGDAQAATPEIAGRLARIVTLLSRHSDAPSAAAQVMRAQFEALGDVVRMPRIVYASQIARTTLFAGFMALATGKTDRVRGVYNEGVAAVPGSDVLTLARGELPVWRIDGRQRRLRATMGESLEGATLLPGGLLMTGLMRLGGCDLFIHGTGGRAYEPVNDRWLPRLIGGTLAPFVTATATLTLDFDDQAPITPESAAHVAWLAHHARHDPSLVGEPEAERTKRGLAARIEALPRHSRERRVLYEQILAILERARTGHRAEIESYQREAERTRLLALEHRLRTDRTWASVLHDPKRLIDLREAIGSRFGQ